MAAGKRAAPAAKADDSGAAAAAAPAETAPAEPEEGLVEDGDDSDEEEEDDDEEEAEEDHPGEAAADDGAGPSAPQTGSAEQVPCRLHAVRVTLYDVPHDSQQRQDQFPGLLRPCWCGCWLPVMVSVVSSARCRATWDRCSASCAVHATPPDSLADSALCRGGESLAPFCVRRRTRAT